MFVACEHAIKVVCFNRTFMELKQQKGAVINYAMFRFNRTFMELKLGIRLKIKTTRKCFNRTFMELKQEKAIADAQAAYEF